MALIYFLTTDPAMARQELAEAGYMQIAINRWATPDRNDIRIITSRRDFQFIPGGTLIIPGRDLADVTRRQADARKEADTALENLLTVPEKNKDEYEQALAKRDATARVAERLSAVLDDMLAFKQMALSGQAQWIGNPLLGDDGTHELIDSIRLPGKTDGRRVA